MGRTALNVLQGFGSPAQSIAELTVNDPAIVKLAALRNMQPSSAGQFAITPALQLAVFRGEALDPYANLPDTYKGTFLSNLGQTIANVAGSATGIGKVGVAVAQGIVKQANAPQVQTLKPLTPGIYRTGGRPMAFADGDSGFFGGVDFNQILQGISGPLLQIGTQAATGYLNQQFAPQPVSMMQTNMAAVPAIVRGSVAVGRSFFNRFPNLATSIQQLRNAGSKVTRGSLWNLMKRFGPDFLISGSILTAAAVSELAMAGPGRRRMNPGNIKALRKAHRRMKSFHHVCRQNDMLLGSPKRRRVASSGSSVTRITQVK
jgi:hypothetical protein